VFNTLVLADQPWKLLSIRSNMDYFAIARFESIIFGLRINERLADIAQRGIIFLL